MSRTSQARSVQRHIPIHHTRIDRPRHRKHPPFTAHISLGERTIVSRPQGYVVRLGCLKDGRRIRVYFWYIKDCSYVPYQHAATARLHCHAEPIGETLHAVILRWDGNKRRCEFATQLSGHTSNTLFLGRSLLQVTLYSRLNCAHIKTCH